MSVTQAGKLFEILFLNIHLVRVYSKYIYLIYLKYISIRSFKKLFHFDFKADLQYALAMFAELAAIRYDKRPANDSIRQF